MPPPAAQIYIWERDVSLGEHFNIVALDLQLVFKF